MEWLSIIGFACFGIFLGFFINGLKESGGRLLQKDFVSLGTLKGKTLNEIMAKVGAANEIQPCTITETGRPGTLRTWSKLPYTITLLFDENELCLGVKHEAFAR